MNMNMNGMIQALFKTMKARGINLPTNVNPKDPDSIINYLLSSGSITQEQYNWAYNQARDKETQMREQFSQT